MRIDDSRDDVQGNLSSVRQGGAFQALFAPVHGGSARFLAPARRFRDTAIDHHIVEVDSNHPVVLRQHQGVQFLSQSSLGLLTHPALDRPVRTT